VNSIASKPISGYETNARVEKLFAPVDIKRNEDGLISEYLYYEFYRQHADDVFDIEGEDPEKIAILYWYLCSYGGHRRKYLPLSAQQIAMLNRPIPVVGLAHPISVAAFSFIRQELGQAWNMSDPTMATEAIYWWCVERSPIMKAEVALVPEYFRAILHRQRHEQRAVLFGTNYFLDRYHAVNTELQFLDLSVESDRAAFLTYMVLKCVANPHFSRYLPTESISRLFVPNYLNSQFSAFQLVLQSFGYSSKAPVDAAEDARSNNENTQASHNDLMKFEQDIITLIQQNGFSLMRGSVVAFEKAGNFGECLRPRNNSSEEIEDKVCLIGPVESFSGLGQATRMSEKSLHESPYQISVINFDMDNPAPKALGTKPAGLPEGLIPATINLVHLNAESIPLVFAYFDHKLYEKSYNIGFFFWELDRIPKCHLLALKMLDEIWVASEYNREIYSKYTELPVVNVGMAVEKLPIKPVADRAKFGLPPNIFLFLTTFDSFSFIQRKNPLAAIESFKTAFPLGTEPVALVIKTQNRTKVDDPPQRRIWDKIDRYCAEDRRIIVLNETMPYEDVLNLKKSCDCYLSLHRSEGWGFGLIESMQCGIPVIATAYGGNMDFCQEGNFFPVSYDLVEPIPTEYIYVERGSRWAQPHIEDAARQMRLVFNDQKLAMQRVKRAREFVEKSFSVQAISARYSARIRDIKQIIRR